MERMDEERSVKRMYVLEMEGTRGETKLELEGLSEKDCECLGPEHIGG